VVYYRPHDRPESFHKWAEAVIDRLGIPVVTHLMDDWMARLGADPEAESSLRRMLERSAACLSIGDAMAEAFRKRYGVTFQPVANCVEPAEWLALDVRDRVRRRTGEPAIMRYVGAFAEDMTLASVVDVARAVDSLNDGCELVFEVYTMEPWLMSARNELKGLRNVSVHQANLSEDAYRQLLVASDILLIAYNFDEASIRYVGYSMANKMPEFLAAGVSVLAYGPRGLATIDYLSTQRVTETVVERDRVQLLSALRRLARDTEYARTLSERARSFVFEKHSCERVREGFHEVLCKAATRHGWSEHRIPKGADEPGLLGVSERAERANFNEVRWVGELLRDVTGGIMVDVGAHRGTSLRQFLEYGWRVYAFEPDSSNRAQLEARYGDNASLVIDSRAVSDAANVEVPFFVSGESTGISSLSPFQESHHQAGVVTTTTLDQAVRQYDIKQIDLLKIDAEGYDLKVLKGLPWEVIHPDVVICEFEDRKTISLGYRFHDMAQYLLMQGYQVWVSEWHPVVRYGIRHDWRRLLPYPCHVGSADAWGNLVAFLRALPEEMLRMTAVQVLERPALLPKSDDRTSIARESGAPQVKVARYSLYYRVASYLQRNHPSIARVGRFALWSLRAIRRQLFGAGGVFLLAVTGLLLASLLVERHSALLAGVAFTGILACFSLLVLGFAEHSFKRYIDQRERLWKKRLAEQEKRETQLRKMNEPNANLLHRLDGQVDRKHLAKLQKDWFPRLGLSLTSEALGYIVRRITSMEDRCTGRLATAVSTEVLRCLVARSITGSSLDILEIGTLFGVNVACMYELCRDFFEKLHVTMIDPLYGYYGPSTLDVLVKIPVTRQVLDRNLNAAGIPESDYTVIQRMSTDTEAISRAKRRQYDLLLIDGDHSEEGVAKDFCAYGPMVKAGGYILFDDYNVPEWPAVKNFVDREVVGREDLEFIGAAWRTAVFKVQVSS